MFIIPYFPESVSLSIFHVYLKFTVPHFGNTLAKVAMLMSVKSAPVFNLMINIASVLNSSYQFAKINVDPKEQLSFIYFWLLSFVSSSMLWKVPQNDPFLMPSKQSKNAEYNRSVILGQIYRDDLSSA